MTTTNVNNNSRQWVLASYDAAEKKNNYNFSKNISNSTEEFVFPNQKLDASNIMQLFYVEKKRVVSLQKKTKVGADGLMIELATKMCTHIDDEFIIMPENIRILTGMSNVKWETDMRDKSPECFKDKIHHHGKLKSSDLRELKNSLIIIDEVDAGSKEQQVLHTSLLDAGLLDIHYMNDNNLFFLFISATMIRELYHLYRWGNYHALYKMTIPDSYIGHDAFLQKNIIQEFYPLNNEFNSDKWVAEDIIDHYGQDFRVHLVRATAKTIKYIHRSCIKNGIRFLNHTSIDRLSDDELESIFNSIDLQHVVVCVKGFFRRANLIPNEWKKKIGCTHELYCKKVDNNVQIQGFPGRLTGYWKDVIESGHKTGPYRTSLRAIQEYEESYLDPFGLNSYQSEGFSKNANGARFNKKSSFLHPKYITNLHPVDLPNPRRDDEKFQRGYQIFDNQHENEIYAKQFGARRRSNYKVENGFKMCSTTSLGVKSLDEIIKFATTARIGSNLDKRLEDIGIGQYAYRRYVCYQDINNQSTEKFVTIWVKRRSF
jgi:hypothetical protein